MNRRTLALALVFISFPAFALVEKGDVVPNLCWKDVADKTVCLDDPGIKDTVRVLLYNGGFCRPCNDEFKTIANATKEFAGQPVTLISLSAAGWKSSSAPVTRKFLEEWRDKWGLDKAPATFLVAGSPFDGGRQFFTRPLLPNAIVIDTKGKLTYKGINEGVPKIVSEIRKVVPAVRPRPIITH